MKILVIGSRVPWPLRDGGAIATYNMLKGLSAAGADVTYFTYNTRKHFADEGTIAANFPFCRVITTYLDATPTAAGALFNLIAGRNYNISRFFSAKAERELAGLLSSEKFDIIQFEGLYATPLLRAGMPAGVPLVLRQHNVEYRIWKKLAESTPAWHKRWYYRLLANQLKQYESATVSRFNALIPITVDDGEVLHEMSPEAKMHTMPVGLELSAIGRVNPVKGQCFHLGSMEWIPNREGVHWLVHEVWPLVRAENPRASLHLAGKGMVVNESAFMADGVEVHGEIADARAFMAEHGVMCVPLFSGGGIRVKIIEAMAAGIPVISTETGTAGIPIDAGVHAELADSPHDFARKLLTLMAHPEKHAEARAFAASHFDLRHLSEELLKFYQSLV